MVIEKKQKVDKQKLFLMTIDGEKSYQNLLQKMRDSKV